MDRKAVLAYYENRLARRAHLNAPERRLETSNNVWRWKMELKDMVLVAGFAYVLRLLCRLARSRGIEVEESWELSIRFTHPATLM